MKAAVNIEGNRLQALGFIIDRIDGLGVPWNSPSEEFAEEILQPSKNQSPYDQSPYEDGDGMANALWRTLCCNRDSDGMHAPDYAVLLEIPWPEDDTRKSTQPFFNMFHNFRKSNSELRIDGVALKSFFPKDINMEVTRAETNAQWPDSSNPLPHIIKTLYGRRLIITDQGYIGLARNETQKGDIVCLLFGASVPMILRPRDDGVSYTFVGDAYIYGYMEGEAMASYESGEYDSMEFAIY